MSSDTNRPTLPADFGKYMLLERIAAGGMAEVFRAVSRGAAGFEKPVALKRVLPFYSGDDQFVALFQDEARIASTLAHANVAQVFDFGEFQGSYFLAMELVEGADLATLNDRLASIHQPWPTATATFIAAEAARGLAYAHDKRDGDGRLLGIVHRDVSPQNILVSYAGEVKLTDFGIAKAAGKVHKTASGVVMGKLRYMSPEQVVSEPVDGRSDIFSLGVILYEMLTGGPVFPGEQTVRLAELIHSAAIPPPSARQPSVPPELDAIVLKALAREPAARYAKAHELARDLTVFAQRAAPGFTREDLATLVGGLFPTDATSRVTAAAATTSPATAPVLAATAPVTVPDRAHAPTVIATPSHSRPIAATSPAPTPATAPARQLDVPTRTRVAGEPGRQAEKQVRPPPRRRRLSRPAWIGLGLAGVILASGALVLVRVAMPGDDAPAAAVPDAAPVAATSPVAAEQARPDAATEPPIGIGDARRQELQKRIDGFSVATRGVETEDYEAFLAAVEFRVATLEVLPGGRPEGPALPDAIAARVERNRVGPAVDAVVAYVAGTGELPKRVRAALEQFVGDHTDAGWSAAALAALSWPTEPRWLRALALANDAQGRWCPPAKAPAVRRLPLLCEREALVAALRVSDAASPLADALERWHTAGASAGAIGVGPASLRLAGDPRWQTEAGAWVLDLAVLALPVDATVALLADGPPASPEALALPLDAGPAAARPLRFTLRTRPCAPVLRITIGEHSADVRMPPAPL